MYLRQAGVKALARSAYREAVTCFDQALMALRPLAETRQKIERAIDHRANQTSELATTSRGSADGSAAEYDRETWL